MAKTVTALLIGIAVAEGKIASIDEPATGVDTAWRDDDRRRIALRHLLQMHAGLKPMGEYEEPYSDASYLAIGTDRGTWSTTSPPWPNRGGGSTTTT